MKKAIEKFGSLSSRDPFWIASYSILGRMDEDKKAGRQWQPDLLPLVMKMCSLYKMLDDTEQLFRALRMAVLT